MKLNCFVYLGLRRNSPTFTRKNGVFNNNKGVNMSKGFVFIVALVLGVLSQNAASAANANNGNQSQSYRNGQSNNYGNSQGELNGNSQQMRNINEVNASSTGYYEPGEVDPNCEYRSGPCVCYCPVTTFKPRYYTVKRCVQEPYCEYKRCCRYVPKYTEKQCCKMVPQYYTQTYCQYVPEYYSVPVEKCRTRVVCEQKCCYVPCTYMKKTCVDCPPADCVARVCGSAASEEGGGCPGGMCARR